MTRNARIVALHQSGASLRAIGREVGLSHEGVRLVLIAAGLVAGKPRPKRPKRPRPVPLGRPRVIDARKAWRMLRFHPLSVVADAMKATQEEVCKALRRHGMPNHPKRLSSSDERALRNPLG